MKNKNLKVAILCVGIISLVSLLVSCADNEGDDIVQDYDDLKQITQTNIPNDAYYSKGIKVYLDRFKYRFVVKPYPTTTQKQVAQFAQIEGVADSLWFIITEKDLKSLRKTKLFEQAVHVNAFKDHSLCAVSGNIMYRPKAKIDTVAILEVCGKGVSQPFEIDGYYAVSVNDWDSIFVYAQRIHETELVNFCEPQFFFTIPQDTISDQNDSIASRNDTIKI